jgi:hypothetical protein
MVVLSSVWAERGPEVVGDEAQSLPAMDGVQVVPSRRSNVRRKKTSKMGSCSSLLLEEEVCCVDPYFRQLWEVPCHRRLLEARIHSKLCWIHSDLWKSRSFRDQDVFPVQEDDVLRCDLKEESNLGERKTFLQALLSVMAGCTGRGHGRGRGSV